MAVGGGRRGRKVWQPLRTKESCFRLKNGNKMARRQRSQLLRTCKLGAFRALFGNLQQKYGCTRIFAIFRSRARPIFFRKEGDF